VIIRLSTDNVTFSSGSAALRPESNSSLDVVGRALRLVSNDIIVEGHTDNRPMALPATNWELSALRASSVLRYFEDRFSLNPAHLQVAGYADTRPIATNDTDEGRTRNRRVEIVIALRSEATVPSNSTAADPALRNPAKPAPIDPLTVKSPGDHAAATTTTTTAAKTKK
jgi:flagellar motor protein MotB